MPRARKLVPLVLCTGISARLCASPVSYSPPSRPPAFESKAERRGAARRGASSFPERPGRLVGVPHIQERARIRPYHDNTRLTRIVRSAIVSPHRGKKKSIAHYSRYARTHTEGGCTAARMLLERKNRAEPFTGDALLFFFFFFKLSRLSVGCSSILSLSFFFFTIAFLQNCKGSANISRNFFRRTSFEMSRRVARKEGKKRGTSIAADSTSKKMNKIQER